jgi:hypothetical protein
MPGYTYIPISRICVGENTGFSIFRCFRCRSPSGTDVNLTSKENEKGCTMAREKAITKRDAGSADYIHMSRIYNQYNRFTSLT